VTTFTDRDVVLKRSTSIWLTGLAVLLHQGADAAKAGSNFFISALAFVMAMPVIEALGCDKAKCVPFIPLLLVLGKLKRAGKLSPWVGPAISCFFGVKGYVSPSQNLREFGMSGELSPFGVMFAKLEASCLLAFGAYLTALALDASPSTAFGAAYAVLAAAALLAGIVDAGAAGMSKAPMFIWAALASGIAYAALGE